MTIILNATGQASLHLQQAVIRLAVQRLNAGKLVAMPTETVYGLAARADLPDAVDAVFRMKGRPASNPLIVHLADAGEVCKWAQPLPGPAAEICERLITRFWPGPLTLVLPALPHVSDRITAGQRSVALRVPAHPVAQALLRQLGSGLVAPSANRYRNISPTSAPHVRRQFPAEPLLVLDGGTCAVGLESTIVALVDPANPRLLRSGTIDLRALQDCCPDIAAHSRQYASDPATGAGQPALRVPGQDRKHYAPDTTTWSFDRLHDAIRWIDPDARTGWLLFEEAGAAGHFKSIWESLWPDRPQPERIEWLPREANACASALYAAMVRLDDSGLDQIMLECPPEGPEWTAIRDRVQRASQPLD